MLLAHLSTERIDNCRAWPQPIKKLKLDDCDRLQIEVPPTAFQTETLTLNLILTSDLQSYESYGHDPRDPYKRSRSKVTRSKV